jgi:hypothetical protein
MNFKKYKNKHQGDRCFIIGNGPSLLKENLSLLKNEKIFICNKGWEAFNISLSHYDYYVLSDANVARFNLTDIEEKVTSPRFYSSVVSRKVPELKTEYIIFNRIKSKLIKTFPKNFNDGWGKVATVVLDAVMIAYFMGFKEIYLLGVDLDYTSNNTHFYKDDTREIKSKDVMNIDYVLATATAITQHLNKRNCNLVNLSKGYKIKGFMNTGQLEKLFDEETYPKH